MFVGSMLRGVEESIENHVEPSHSRSFRHPNAQTRPRPGIQSLRSLSQMKSPDVIIGPTSLNDCAVVGSEGRRHTGPEGLKPKLRPKIQSPHHRFLAGVVQGKNYRKPRLFTIDCTVGRFCICSLHIILGFLVRSWENFKNPRTNSASGSQNGEDVASRTRKTVPVALGVPGAPGAPGLPAVVSAPAASLKGTSYSKLSCRANSKACFASSLGSGRILVKNNKSI